MGEALAILFLVLPGFLGWNLFERIRRPEKESPGHVLAAVFGSMMFGVWIDTLNYLILKLFYPMNTLESLVRHLNRLEFIFCFAGLSIISMIVTAVTWNILISEVIIWMDERFYRIGPKNRTAQWSNVCHALFQKDNEPCAVLIEKGGKVVGKGLIKCLKTDSRGIKEVYLENIAHVDGLANSMGFRGTYINFDTDVVVREYELQVPAEQTKKAVRKTLKIKRLYAEN